MPPKSQATPKRTILSPDSDVDLHLSGGSSDHIDQGTVLQAGDPDPDDASTLSQIREILGKLTQKVDDLTSLALALPILRDDINQLRQKYEKETDVFKSFTSEFQEDFEEKAKKMIQLELQYVSNTCSTNTRSTNQRIDELTEQPSIAVTNQIYTKLTGTIELFHDSLLSFKRSTDKQFVVTQDLQEMNHNPVAGPPDDSYASMIQAYHGYRKYKSGNGSISFYQLILRSPDVLELYSETAR